ncbi:HAD-IA family hydrolase [Actibacterium sp. MT2.3-13A]|uniref:HAD-IA family hydrolase n=1 Tax=Actibacterium sp. MT2.3-13A TaxID=2828332 RepID=UPI001BA9144F|nr:HAD-IA family hydrolase [Actibacterium sp. MT2.3-13A]
MTLRALIFDLDGTLAETEEAHREAFNRSFADRGLGWHWGRDTYGRLLKTAGGKERLRAWQDGLPAGAPRLGDDEIAQLHQEKTARYGEILARGGLSLRPGVADLVAAAREAGLKLAVATTTSRRNVEALCRCCWRRPADAVFDAIASGDMVAAQKPAPDLYLLALDKLALPADHCLAFEDSLNGLLSARGAGLRVAMTASAYTRNEDHSAADWRLQGLETGPLPPVLRAALAG